jgi:hypothetical protein
MIETPNLIVGILIILINLIPLIMRKYKYLIFTSIVSVFLILLLNSIAQS